MTKPIIAGAFTIEEAPAELVESLGALLGLQDSAGNPILPVDMRTMSVHSAQEIPPLFAMAMPLPIGMVWMIKGITDVAVLPIKEKYVSNPKKLDRPLVAWALTFTDEAAVGLVRQSYAGALDDDTDDTDDGSIHVTVELPLDEIDVHREPETDFNEWLDALSDVAEAALDRADSDGEVILFDASEDGHPGLAGHISVLADDDEDAINLVRDALAEAFAPFTPVDEVRDRLNLEIEEMCLYSMLSGLMGDMGDEDLPD